MEWDLVSARVVEVGDNNRFVADSLAGQVVVGSIEVVDIELREELPVVEDASVAAGAMVVEVEAYHCPLHLD